ncbi:flagellar basal-body MS-ring/collar protein FliF [Lichenihabitans sp. Uapishka_5]|uniref:flagellar basal-body MS-ring/collar protein FliF n=1 Tax=Lichenihabitans sp. Uapishka_5 TaxID=3037302 RepID=UPI0029E81FD3|nr:flagellar basal-body MS-ring/collar protein FliF [Lichenihabitans sp. Uapishka_5]MDX7952123.1 flagellar basal-body MS-ring/collar protein FliF [Lichenihabitans sp. Uapishka_5]
MNPTEQVQRLWANLLQLGARKLGALAAIGAATFLLVGIAGYYLSRPSMETLYAGLDRQDVSGIGAALRDADIPFDVSADGTSVSVHYGQTAQARMLLAEKGLPHSANAGYELYDKMGSLGLTSFMQDVTRVRALEGELARTVQSMSGIKAARVHIVLPDEGSFRRAKQPATASVLIRATTVDDAHAAQAIRHLVAAAVPGMTPDNVTVLSTDGTVLASGDDAGNAAPGKMLDLEKQISREVGDNIRKTLSPSLGVNNLQISVAAKLNTDTKQTAETTYNPDGRVERSTRTVKESQNSQNSSATPPTTAGQNVPQNNTPGSSGKQSNEENNKKEDLTNYEISSKTVTTVSAGYAVEHLSIAVVLNRAALLTSLGLKAGSEVPPAKLAEIEQLAASAAGIEKARGDSIKVMAADFVDAGKDLEAVPSVSITDALMRQSGTLINAAMILGVTLLVLFFAVRPLTRVLGAPRDSQGGLLSALPIEPTMGLDGGATMALPDPSMMNFADAGASMTADNPLAAMDMGGFTPSWDAGDGDGMLDELRPRKTPQKRLEQMIEFDEAQAAAILKLWIHKRAAA